MFFSHDFAASQREELKTLRKPSAILIIEGRGLVTRLEVCLGMLQNEFF